MTNDLRIVILLFSMFILTFLMTLLRKNKMPIKYSIVWLMSIAVIASVAIFPSFFGTISTLLGFHTMANMMIAVFVGLLLMITMALTVIASRQSKKIILLIQEVSLLKQKLGMNKSSDDK